MKKLSIILILITSLSLIWCSSKKNTSYQNTDIETKLTNENNPLINVKEKIKKVEKNLKKIWLTGEKLKQELAKQKVWLEIIAKAKWESRKKYILETEILPKIIKAWKVNKKCTTTNLNNYLACLYVEKTDINKLLDELPPSTKNFVKKTYYEKVYSLDRKKILEKTSDPIAIQAKKEKIKQMYQDGVLRKKTNCDLLVEKEVKNYCKSLFK